MPHGLFDYENVIEPMGLSPQALPLPTFPKVPQQIPPNTQLVTMAIPEGSPSPTNPLLPSVGFGNDMLDVTMAIPENAPSGNPTTLAVGESGIVTDALIGSEARPINTLRIPENPVTPPITMAMPEGGVIPTPPSSGQCPAGYQQNQVEIGIGTVSPRYNFGFHA